MHLLAQDVSAPIQIGVLAMLAPGVLYMAKWVIGQVEAERNARDRMSDKLISESFPLMAEVAHVVKDALEVLAETKRELEVERRARERAERTLAQFTEDRDRER